MTGRGRYDPDELIKLKQQRSITAVLKDFGIKVRGGMCLCPFHNERTPSCQVFEKEGRIHCHACQVGGDHFDVIIALKGGTFPDAVRFLGGTKEVTYEERQKIRADREKLEAAELEKDAKARKAAQELFDLGDDIKRTLAEEYFNNRGLKISRRMWFDLRYIDELTYRGFPDKRANEREVLGKFPALLAAIRMPETKELIGCHRTYIDRATGLKLKPPGDLLRNRAKKILGQFVGGMIHLSPPAPTLLIGEGIETTESGYALKAGGPDCAVAAGVNLWNICGRALGFLQNPGFPDDPTKRVPNCEPDPEKPGIVKPSWAKSIIVLGDGDSDYFWTQAMVATALAKFEAQGAQAATCFADDGMDFNDLLLKDQEAVA